MYSGANKGRIERGLPRVPARGRINRDDELWWGIHPLVSAQRYEILEFFSNIFKDLEKSKKSASSNISCKSDYTLVLKTKSKKTQEARILLSLEQSDLQGN